MKKRHGISSYLRLLPEIYSEPQTLAQYPFLANYLKIFEKIMTGLDLGDETLLEGRKGWGQVLNPEVIGELFYPRLSFLFPGSTAFIPPITPRSLQTLNEFFGISQEDPQSGQSQETQWLVDLLDFIASWIDLYLDHDFLDRDPGSQPEDQNLIDRRLDKMREIIARIMPLYRKRGTREGLQGMIDLFIDLNWQGRPLLEVKIIPLNHATPWHLGVNSTLHAAYRPLDPLVGGVRPWVFLLDITILCLETGPHRPPLCGPPCWRRINETIEKIIYLVDREKPLQSSYVLEFHPTLEVGVARLGSSSLLGSPFDHRSSSQQCSHEVCS